MKYIMCDIMCFIMSFIGIECRVGPYLALGTTQKIREIGLGSVVLQGWRTARRQYGGQQRAEAAAARAERRNGWRRSSKTSKRELCGGQDNVAVERRPGIIALSLPPLRLRLLAAQQGVVRAHLRSATLSST